MTAEASQDRARSESMPAIGPPARHGLVTRIRALTGLAVSGAIFWYVGWWVVGPNDPSGAISLLTVDHGVIAMAEMLALSVVAGALAVAVAGAGMAHHGALAIAFGLAVLNLRGGQLDVLINGRLIDGAAGSRVAAFPTTELIAETFLWLALIAVGFVVGRWVDSWHATSAGPEPVRSPKVDSPSEIRQGVFAAAITILCAYNLFRFFGGATDEAVLKGQVYFSVGASFLLATMLARWLCRESSRIWGLAAVGVVALAAYWFNGPTTNELTAVAGTPAYLVLPPAVRVLPIEFAALGAMGVLLAHGLSPTSPIAENRDGD